MSEQRHEHEHEQEPPSHPSHSPIAGAAPAVARLPGSSPRQAGLGPADALALQHSAGNRAVARHLAAGAGERRIDRARQTVHETMLEKGTAGNPDVGWEASYDVEFTGGECVITVFVLINRDAGVTEADATRVRRQTRAAFQRFWDNRFEFEDLDTGDVFPVRVRLEGVQRRQHLTVQLHAGAGRDDLSNWFVASSSNDRAHELGHQIGMYDEYVDPAVANRATAASPGVFSDHSIMGDYPNEGVGRARARRRHGNRLARRIGAATGRRLTSRYRTATPPTPAAAPAPPPPPVPAAAGGP